MNFTVLGARTTQGRRFAKGFLVVAALALAAAACGDDGGTASTTTKASTGGAGSAGTSGPANTDPYVVPLLGDMTGAFAANGAAGVAGIQAAVKVVNDAGGINGHPIKLSAPIDSMSTADGATQAAVQAVSSKPVVMTGQVYSGGLAGMVPTMDQAKIPYVSASSLDSILLPKPSSWFFTTSSTSAQQAVLEVGQMKALLGGSLTGKKIGFVGLASPSVDGTLTDIKKLIEQEGATLNVTERTASGQVSSFSAQAANIASAKPDALITVDSAANTVIVAKAVTDAGYKGPITSSTGANDDGTLKAINLANFYAPRTYNSAADSKIMGDAASKAGVTDKTNNAFFAQGYTTGMALIEGLKKCGFPCTASTFPAAMESVTNVTLGDVGFGPLQFAADRHFGVTAVQFFGWDNTAQKAVAKGNPVKV